MLGGGGRRSGAERVAAARRVQGRNLSITSYKGTLSGPQPRVTGTGQRSGKIAPVVLAAFEGGIAMAF